MFYCTPILYSPDMFAGTKLEFLMNINPMAIVINAYKDILYWQNMPRVKALSVLLVCSIILCFIGLLIFRKLSKGFAEEV